MATQQFESKNEIKTIYIVRSYDVIHRKYVYSMFRKRSRAIVEIKKRKDDTTALENNVVFTYIDTKLIEINY